MNLSAFAVTGSNNPEKQVSVNRWNSFLDAIEGGAGPSVVATRVAMSAEVAVEGAAITLAESGREGMFVFSTANLSAQVTDDPQQGIYVAPSSDPSGANGAWVRKFDGPVNLRWFGAVGDGITDDTPAVQAAITAAAPTGKALYIPAPSVAYRTTAPIICAPAIRVFGEGVTQTFGGSGNLSVPAKGSWFFLDHTGIGFYCLDDASPNETKGMSTFRGVGTYRTHAAPAAAWTPTVYGADFLIAHRASLDDVTLLNPYIGVKVIIPGVLWVNNLRGQPLYTGIEIQSSSDALNMENIHFWPFWSQNADVYAYTIPNAVGMRVRRADGLKVSNFFCYGMYRNLLAQDVTGDGSGMAGFSFDKFYSDKNGGNIEIKSDFYAAYGTINSILCNSDSAVGGTGPAIWIRGTVASQVNILGLEVARAHDEALLVEGAAHTVHVQAHKVSDWDRRALSKYAFKADNGATINLLTIPVFSGPTLYYDQGANGVVNYPATYKIGAALLLPTGMSSTRATIAVDGVMVIPAPAAEKTCTLVLTPASIPGAGNPAGTYYMRCSASPSGVLIAATHTANIDVGTGVLTGTTGTAGNLRINAANDGNIYIENRTASAKAFIVTLLGN